MLCYPNTCLNIDKHTACVCFYGVKILEWKDSGRSLWLTVRLDSFLHNRKGRTVHHTIKRMNQVLKDSCIAIKVQRKEDYLVLIDTNTNLIKSMRPIVSGTCTINIRIQHKTILKKKGL